MPSNSGKMSLWEKFRGKRLNDISLPYDSEPVLNSIKKDKKRKTIFSLPEINKKAQKVFENYK